ncbi:MULTISPECIES: DUF3809 domain-containing protein [unclassified Meiothermus]|uniref:DUF3809 domain-containing protein n=1 Tax=unclassified Meiothermus TaxID=370471 RepID=UPI000D7C6666|nr:MULTISPECIES: DUF3809 domain-containing protein [unclassified Meiothermus]PZA08789.1 DUF3809 domain-containing protein [Meiothermus sp. Pnk-1]RYM40589.1 DUF3809 domain-containing protein [Meiothermus sp. PNK-Is4]
MTLERTFELRIPGSPAELLAPERVFGERPPFQGLHREGEHLVGELVAYTPLMGELRFPFRSHLQAEDAEHASLTALPLDEGAPPAFWAELSGEGTAVGGALAYTITVRLHARLPEGEKWGGKALRRMAEAAFQRTISRALEALNQR